MVALRRIKHLVQLSAVGLLILTFLIFVQWDDISYNARFKRHPFGLSEQDEISNDDELLALERDLDVDRILKKIEKDVSLRLKNQDEILHNNSQKETLLNLRQLANNGNDSEDSTSTPNPTADNLTTESLVRETSSISKPKTRDTENRNSKASRDREHRRHLKKFKWETYPWQPGMRGQLNVHVWQAWCGNTIHDLRRNWFFPLYPDLHLTVSRFFVKHYEDDYGQRIFGYIHPPLTGKYIFALSSDDTSELWLSKDENPENVKLLSWVGNLTSLNGSHKTNAAEFTKYNTQLSRQIYLKKGQKYFIEALHKQGTREDHILVGWKIPGLPGFRYITGDSISMYIGDQNASSDVTHYAKFIPQTLPSHTHSRTWSVVLDREVHKFGSNNEPEVEHHNRRKVSLKSFTNVLPNCTYEPSYLVNFTLRRYEGVKLIHDSAVYPNDNTLLTHMKPYDKCLGRRTTDSHGNSLNNKNPKLTNHTLYEEGKIQVFGPDGKDSVVTTPSDLSDEFPIESFLEGDSLDGRSAKATIRSLDEQVRLLMEVYKENKDLQKQPIPLQHQDEIIQSNDPRDSYNRIVDRIKINNGIIEEESRRRRPSSAKLRQPDTNTRKERMRSDVVPKRVAKGSLVRKPVANHKILNQIKSAQDIKNDIKRAELKSDRNRTRKKSRKPQSKVTNTKNNYVKSVRKAPQQNNARVAASNDKAPLIRTKGQSNEIHKDSQGRNLEQDSHRSKGSAVPRGDVRVDHQMVNNLRPRKQGKNTATSRKLLFSKIDQRNQLAPIEKNDDLDDEDSNVIADNDEDDDVDDDDEDVMAEQDLDDLDEDEDDEMAEQDLDDLDEDEDDEMAEQDLDDLDEDEDDEEAQILSANKAQANVPVVYFRPYGTVQHNRTLPQFQYEDTLLSRLNSAREYVRRMQKLVQIYQYHMASKQLSDQVFRRFGVRMQVPELMPYMNYNPWIYHHNTTKCTSDGNLLLNENVAKSVASRYMTELENKIPNTYTLGRIINIQENHDVINGDRYLMELELFDHKQSRNVRVSQYIYQALGQTRFCLPHNFKIKHHATVHVIVPVKNQGRWVQYFIDDMSELYLKTGDPHLNVIIVDFSSDDIDVEEAFRRSPLARYRVITLTGPFQRAYGIQAGTSIVRNPNDIIFMCDLHLEIPNNLIDVIRKHCIQGRMAFAPIVTRLHCGFTPTIPYGFWELQGYGLFAMYKSDFSKVGGMNYREFGTRWGGEDWELLDRVLLHKMEVERLRIPHFYHFYHSKKGMWGSPTIDTVYSDVPEYYKNKNQIIPPYRPRVRVVSSKKHLKNTIPNRQRQLISKRNPSRAIRPASRIRRGYRPRRNDQPVQRDILRNY